MLKGYKAYIIGFLLIIAAGLNARGYIDTATYQLIEGILLGGGIMAIRAGIKKVE